NANLFAPRRSASEQQVRHVSAGDEQHESRHPEQHREERIEPWTCESFAHQLDHGAGDWRFAARFADLTRYHFHLFIGLSQLDSRFQTSRSLKPAIVAIIETISSLRHHRLQGHWNPQVAGVAGNHAVKSLWRDADDCHVRAVEQNVLADYALVA